jgi:hypothetical protein
MKTVFVRALEADDKSAVLLTAIRNTEAASGTYRFEVNAMSLGAIPGSPFAYWVSSGIREIFQAFLAFDDESAGRTTRCGLGTLDDWRFLRLNWESRCDRSTWVTYYHGGVFSRFYDHFPLLVRWEGSGREVKAFVEQRVGSASRKVQGEDRYFIEGFVFPRRTKALAPKVMPGGGIFSTGGQAGFTEQNELMASIAILSSRICSYLISLAQGRTGDAAQFEVGLIKRLPWPYRASEEATFSALAHRAWSLKRGLDPRIETSHAFILPALLEVTGDVLTARAEAWAERVQTIESELATIQAEIDERGFDLYGIDEADRRVITEGFGGSGTAVDSSGDVDESEDDAGEDGEEDASVADAASLAAELVSWAVGVAFGRFDVRLATGVRPMPAEPEPFDPLPACSPGMLAGGDGLPLALQPEGYPLAVAEAGVLVDDPGHAQDLTTAVRAVFEVVFGADADRWWHEVAALLDPKGHELRVWLAGSFFEHHLKRYSKSRRKAPILWQLGTPTGQYSVWLYAHRLTRDSFFQLQNEVVSPKLTHEEQQLTSLIQNAGGSPSASERKEIAAQEAVVEELRAMLDEVKRVAPLWNLNLDDGVVLTIAPLWRLVPQHKPWQKELKSKWDELAAGKYDWAHLAMHLWPERVVPKCATDRSLAIAHGLEDVFWAEGADGKWKARTTPVRAVDEVVRERSSPAVKAALKSLLDASAPSNGGTRGRRRASSAATEGVSR